MTRGLCCRWCSSGPLLVAVGAHGTAASELGAGDGTAVAVADGSARTARPLDAGRAIATMCTSLPQWFDNAGPVSREQIAREYAELALRMVDARPRVRGGP